MNARLCRNALLGCVTALAFSTVPSAAAKLQVLYSFVGGSGDGAHPFGPVTMDGDGSLYGTTVNGGGADDGTVFRVSPRGQETVLHVFTGTGGEGSQPEGGVIADATRNLYGTTPSGGENGLGIVFKLAPSGVETILHTFQGICCGSDGSFPASSLIADKHGNMYGTTQNGGNSSDLGTIFRITPDGTEDLVYAFSGTDGSLPLFGLTLGNGALYGATYLGGAQNTGVAFRMTTGGTETVLHQFGAGSDGQYPEGWIAVDSFGTIYGTTLRGGGSANAGIVYTIDKNGVESVVHVFNGADGASPVSVTLIGKNLYGVTQFGGAHNLGTVFRIAPSGVLTVLHSFAGPDGSYPLCPLFTDSAGNLYGTTTFGGAQDDGVVFKLTIKKKKRG